MAKPEQEEMFPQKKINAIERWAIKADEQRALIVTESETLANHEFKLAEAMHLNEADVDHQETEDGDKLLIYKRGAVNVVIKRGKEKVNYKVKEVAKGSVSEESSDDE